MPLSRSKFRRFGHVFRPVTSTNRSSLAGIAVLDGVGEQVDQRQLQPADIHNQRRHVIGDTTSRPAHPPFPEAAAPPRRPRRDRHLLQLAIVGLVIDLASRSSL